MPTNSNNEKKAGVTNNSVVAKDNSLISFLCRFDLTELRFLTFCIAHYDSRKGNYSVTTHVSDFCKVYNITKGKAYNQLKQIFRAFNEKPYEAQIGKKQIIRNWFTGADYDGGYITFTLNKEIEPLLLELKGSFSKYRLRDVSKIRSAVAWRLYENLNQRHGLKTWTVELELLKSLLGIENKHPRWQNLKMRVIEPCLKEINEVTNLEVSYQPVKKGRTVASVAFFIDTKQQPEVITLGKEKEELFKKLLEMGLGEDKTSVLTDKAVTYGLCTELIEKIPDYQERWMQKKIGTLSSAVEFCVNARIAELEVANDEQQGGEELYSLLCDCGLAQKTAITYAENALRYGVYEHFLDKVPTLKERWERKKSGSLAAYVTGVLKQELAKLDEPKVPDEDMSPPSKMMPEDRHDANNWKHHLSKNK
jgi:plasmid replication initiation protein